MQKQGGEGTHALGIVEEQQAAIHSFGYVLATVHGEGEIMVVRISGVATRAESVPARCCAATISA